MSISPVVQRMAELWMINKKRGMNETQMQELHDCLSQNAAYCLKRAHLENLSYVAYEIGDMDWVHSICAELEALANW